MNETAAEVYNFKHLKFKYPQTTGVYYYSQISVRYYCDLKSESCLTM